eukprot:1140960-Pelagomonas_calceolata.AAC.2
MILGKDMLSPVSTPIPASRRKAYARAINLCSHRGTWFLLALTCMSLPMEATSTSVSVALTGWPCAAARSRTCTVRSKH